MTPEKLAAVFALSMALGAGIKRMVPFIENRYIPAITFVFFMVLGLWGSGWDVSFENIIQLGMMAFGPTGLHQLSTRTLERKESDAGPKDESSNSSPTS